VQTIRDDLKALIDSLSEREVVALWRFVAAMRQPEALTPEEAAGVDHALMEVDAGEFVDWEAVGQRTLTVDEAYEQIRALGLRTPDESTTMIREDRDAR
jgi:predicted transcriptional regulator